jgi:predicted metal-dependent enzyme (double-stranded beta helix superfamily)
MCSTTIKFLTRAAFAVVLFAGLQTVKAAEPDPAVMTFKLPDQITWTGRPGGPQTALVQGDPNKDGSLYVQFLKWPKGTGSMPHNHPTDRFIYVISGTWYKGAGKEYKPETMVPVPAGSFVRDIAHEFHYDQARDEETIIEMVGIGPASEPRGAPPAPAREPGPKSSEITLAKDVKWTGSANGPQNATLWGDPNKEGLYIVLTKWTPGHMSRPHFHPNDRFIHVISGTWFVGWGPKYDPDSTYPMPAGSFVRHIGKQIHYDGAKTEDALLEIVGMGPATSTPAEQK